MKKKVFIKHPLYLLASLEILVLFLLPAIMLNLNSIVELSEKVNAIIGISVGVFAVLSLIVLYKNGDKYIKQEQKERLKKIKKNAFTDKRFVLIQKRSVLANLALIFGCILIYLAWLVLLPIQKFNGIGYWIFRISSILITSMGGIFSFITPKKMLVYRNGQLQINTDEKQVLIKPSELLGYKKNIIQSKLKGSSRGLFCDMVLYLSDKEFVLKKADCCVFFKDILQLLKKIEPQNKEVD